MRSYINNNDMWKKEHFCAHLCGMSLTNRLKYLDSIENILNNQGKYLLPINYETKNIIIIDNFYNDVDDVRKMALNQEFNIKGNSWLMSPVSAHKSEFYPCFSAQTR